MNDRDVEAQPGDKHRTEPDLDSLDLPVESKPLVLPPKADVARSDQARRQKSASAPKAPRKSGASLPAAPLLRTTGTFRRPAAQAHPIDEPHGSDAERNATGRETTDAPYRPARLSAAHPLSRLRTDASGRGAGSKAGRGIAAALVPGAGLIGDRFTRRRGVIGRPSKRGLFGLAGLTATVGIVTALLVTLPSQPSTATPTGSVYSIDWHGVTNLPVANLDFGPFFTPMDNGLLMAGTVNTTTTNNGVQTVSSVTTVWSTTDGVTWSQTSDSGAFTIDGRRFVAQGICDDGQGGLVVFGNSLGKTPTDVVASAWHSKDGGAWTSMQVDSSAGQEMAAGIASRPGLAVAAGNGVAWLTTDGRSWSPQVLPGAVTSNGSYTPSVVGSWGGGFVIVGLWIGTGAAHSTAWYSTTGRDWTQSSTPLNGFLASGVANVAGRIVVVGSDLSDASPGLAASWSSTDGNDWTESTAPTDVSSVALDGVAKVGHSLLAFGAPAAASTSAAQQLGTPDLSSTAAPNSVELVWVSDDGTNWLPLKSTASPLSDAHMGAIGNRAVMVGGLGNVMKAITGDLTLGAIRPPASQAALANLNLNIRLGNVPMTPDVTVGYSLGPVTTSGNRFYTFAVGAAGTAIFNSSDGGLWVLELRPAGLTLAAVAGATVVTGRPVVLQAIPDGKGGILAAGKITDTTGDNGMIWHMTKAGTWRQVNFQDDTPTDFTSITAGPNGFVASSDSGASGSQVMYSTDGDTWQASTIAVNGTVPITVGTYHYGFVAVGSDPAKQGATTAWTSPDGRTWTMRSDWRMPPNVTAVFGMGYSIVATAKTTIPGAAASASASPGASGSASSSASPSASPTATPKVTAKPKPTPTLPSTVKPVTWWWSATGVGWQTSGLQSAVGNWQVIGSEILVLDPPTKLSDNWTAWTSPDGRIWKHPQSSAVSFAGSKTCYIASRGSSILVVGWHADGVLEDYYGDFGTSY
jgi:hypothetical protein